MNFKKYRVVDSHCDTVTFIEKNKLDFYDNKVSHLTVKNMLDSNVKIQFMAVYIDYDNYFPNCYFEAISYINKIYEYEKKYKNLKIIKTKEDLNYVLDTEDKIGIIITVEGGHIINDNIEILKSLSILGVKSLTLTWNYKNSIACGCIEDDDFGLTQFGKKIIREMEDMNMIVDISHSSKKTFWDVISIVQRPIIASHSLSKYVNNHKRNLTDDQIKKISDLSGIIGINYYKEFVGKNENIVSLVDHIERIIYIGGSNCIGLGSDFDGCDIIDDIKDVRYTYLISNELLKRNYNEEIIMKIFSNNYIDLLNKFL